MITPVQSIDSIALSVVIPTYNRSSYVRDCLRSLRRIDIPDLEIVVADDGSTDNTPDVVRAEAPGAQYLWQPNSGTPSTARNAGFTATNGRYVGFLDCDDEWLPGGPERALVLLERYPEVDVLFADALMGNPMQGYSSWIASAGQDDFYQLPAYAPEIDFRILDRRALFRRMSYRNPVFIGSCILRREAFANVGGFDSMLRGAADWELWLRLADRCTFGFLNQPLAVYHRHDDNMSSERERMIGEFCRTLQNIQTKCELSQEDAGLIHERLLSHMFDHAYLAYDEYRMQDARVRFRKLLRCGDRRLKTLGYLCFAHVPLSLVRFLRLGKRAFGL